MKFLLSSLLLASLCALSSWSASSDSAAVTQSPDVTVSEGDTVELSCCWTAEYERMRVLWLRNQTNVKNVTFEINNMNEHLIKKMSDCWNLTLTAVTEQDAGTYICKVIVEIPELFTAEGKGTVVTVTAKDNTTLIVPEGNEETPDKSQVPSSVIISLAIVCPLLLVALCCFCFLKRKEAQAARVIYEVPHTDSDVADMDKQSTTSSRGSSQWCQVPVYESFDYFERVQTKGTG